MYSNHQNTTTGLTWSAQRKRRALFAGKGLPVATPSVILAGRRPTMLLSLKRLVETEFEVAAMADNILSMLDALREIVPDMLVLDTGSVEFGGGSLPLHLHQRHPELCILLVGDEGSGPQAPHPAGCAYVSKQSAVESLVPTARELLARGNADAGLDGTP
jgi:DNA-binding NarL/FixJ family response regulator